MSEYIKRDDVLKLIYDLSVVTTADVVEVVRCKDCRKWGNPNLCPFGKRYMPLGDGYCHAGERREDGEIH